LVRSASSVWVLDDAPVSISRMLAMLSARAIGEQTIVADAMKPLRQEVD
jgi:hypothetical protein